MGRWVGIRKIKKAFPLMKLNTCKWKHNMELAIQTSINPVNHCPLNDSGWLNFIIRNAEVREDIAIVYGN